MKQNNINPTNVQAEREIAKKFIRIFPGLPNARGAVNGACIKGIVTLDHVIRHLEGIESLGRYPIFKERFIRWAAVDFDFKKAADRVALSEKHAKEYAKALFELGIKCFWFERSKSGLIHLWILFKEPVLANKPRYILLWVANKLGLKIFNGIVEIYPKHDELNEDHQYGNYINLPYFGALNGGEIERRVILDPNTFLPISLGDFLSRVDSTLISALEVDAVYDSLTENISQDDTDEQTNTDPTGSKPYSETSWQIKREKIIEIIRPYWVEGNRQSLSLHLADLLCRNQIMWVDTKNLILEIAALCKDTETAQRIGAIKCTYEKQRNGGKTNYKGIKEIVSAADFERLFELFTRASKTNNKPDIPWSVPLAEDAYHGLVGEVVRTIKPYSEADPVALLMNFLTAFGNIIGDKPHFRVEADKHPMRLFTVLVGETSKARKGTSWGYLKNIFGVLDPDWKSNIQTGLSSGEGLIWAVRDEIRKKQPVKERGRVTDYEEVIVDEGVKDKRVLVMEGEFASTLRVLGRDGNILSAIIRNAWDTGDLQTLTKNSPAKATGAHISIIGHITQQELLRYLSGTEAANGFGNRFLWFCVKRSKSLPFDSGFHKINLEPLIKRLKEVTLFTSNTYEITWAEKTRPLWAEIYPEMSEGKSGLFGALTARAEADVTRLACIYSLLDVSGEIKTEHLKAAIAIWDYVESSIRYIFQDATGDPLANEILEMGIEKAEGLTRTDIYKFFNCNVSSDRIAEALETLRGLGKARCAFIQTEGRSREVWFFNEI